MRDDWLYLCSRDGVTPFGLMARDGATELQHSDWQRDLYHPLYGPQLGERIFVSLTQERAREKATRYVEGLWDDPEMPMREHEFFAPLGRDGAIEYFAKEWYGEGGAPDLVEVTEAVLAELRRARGA